MTSSLIKKLSSYANTTGLSINEYTLLIENVQKMQLAVKSLEVARQKEINDCQKRVLAINEEIEKIRLSCNHEVFTYNQGCQGMKSYSECDLCGKEVIR